jgi:8-oxo-dGTP pyrophosphatase MutT (NUDIX family)
MRREYSAGGVLVRRLNGRWMVAAIRPAGRPPGLWALPKGRIDPGESGEATALREIAEETGARGRSLGKLGDVRYWFNWEGERVFKVVSFFLVRYEGGRLGDIPAEFRHEVAEVRWLSLDDAGKPLAYAGEREMARNALDRLEAQCASPAPAGGAPDTA